MKWRYGAGPVRTIEISPANSKQPTTRAASAPLDHTVRPVACTAPSIDLLKHTGQGTCYICHQRKTADHSKNIREVCILISVLLCSIDTVQDQARIQQEIDRAVFEASQHSEKVIMTIEKKLADVKKEALKRSGAQHGMALCTTTDTHAS